MAGKSSNVTYKLRELCEGERPLIPGLAEYACAVRWLASCGVLDGIVDRLRLNRSGGYVGLDLVLVVFAYLCTGRQYEGIHGFCDDAGRKFGEQLASIADRKRWPTQSAVSRLFASVELGQAEEFAEWLLTESIEPSALWNHESALYRDCEGEGWHAFHFDHSVTALRERALPEGEGLPEPRRHADDFAKAGYAGRKRGEVQISRGTLQHRGTGLYHLLTLAPGNGRLRDDLVKSAAHVARWSECVGVDTGRCVIITDGATGGWAQMEVPPKSGVRYLTRLGYYKLLDNPEVMARVLSQPWEPVQDSRSGPRRWATELGSIQHNGRRVRLVLSKFEAAADGKKRGAGVVIDGWQYEVFATDLPCVGWPAAEVVTFYYGRCGQENHFGREDAVLGLDHVFSYHLGGQLLAITVGLWLWNIRILLGGVLEGGLAEVPAAQLPRKAMTEIPEPINTTVSADVGDEAKCSEPPSAAHNDMNESEDNEASPDPDVLPEGTIVVEHLTAIGAGDEVHGPEALRTWAKTMLSRAALQERIDALGGWSVDPETGLPTCPLGETLRLHQVRAGTANSVELRFRALRTDCAACPLRGNCTASMSERFEKEVAFRVAAPSAQADLAQRLYPRRRTRSSTGGSGGDSRNSPSSAARTATSPSRVAPPELGLAAGPFAVRGPVLLALSLANQFRDHARDALIHIDAQVAATKPKPPDYYTMDDADRQRRRQTWEQRNAWNALPEGSSVTVNIALPPGRLAAHAALEPRPSA